VSARPRVPVPIAITAAQGVRLSLTKGGLG